MQRTESQAVTIPARPESITIDTARTAALVIDMQNDFCAEGGMFDRAGIDISTTRAAVGPTMRTLAAARKAKLPVVYLKQGHRPDLSDLGAPDAPHRLKHLPMAVGTTVVAPDGRESRILVRDTWNTEIVDEVKPQAGDTVIYKTRYSGFYQTDLDSVLRGRDIRCLIVMGATTSICVESTVRDATFRDYRCILLEDCTGEPIGHGFSRSNYEASLLTIERLFGWISSSEKVIQALGSSDR